MTASPHRWSAKQWQQRNSQAFREWRSRERGPTDFDFETMCGAVSDVVRILDTPDRVAARLGDVFGKCDDLDFDSTAETAAYTLAHMADRYGRSYQVLELLFEHGYLPVRKNKLNVLDVGAGPGPSTFAAIDFYRQLADWADDTHAGVAPSHVTFPAVLERGRAWSPTIHNLTEFLNARRASRGDGTERVPAGPLGVHFTELGGFSARAVHHEQRARLSREIQAEWDDDWDAKESASTPSARAAAYAAPSPALAPSAYDIVFVSNFVTQRQLVDRYRTELRGLATWLSPGGILVALGSSTATYENIWRDVRSAVEREQVISLNNVSGDLQANCDPSRHRLIRAQQISDRDYLRASGATVPRKFETLTQRTPFPPFRVMAWRNRGDNSARLPRSKTMTVTN